MERNYLIQSNLICVMFLIFQFKKLEHCNRNLMKNRTIIKPTLAFISLALIISIFFALYESYQSKSTFGVKIDKQMMTKNSQGLSFTLDHELGENIPSNLKIKINNGFGKTYFQPLTKATNNSLIHQFTVKRSQIKYVFLHSQQHLKVKAKGRVLQTSEQSPPSFDILISFYSYFFTLSRNLIILACITNTFDIWMPILTFIELFLCLGFWTHEPHKFATIFANAFSYKFDLFNFIRLAISAQYSPSANPYLAQFGFTNRFVLNCSGQISLLIILLLFACGIKLSTLFIKNQRIRSIGARIRPVINGYFFWMSPRIVSLAGLSLRQAGQNPNAMQIIHLGVACLMIIVVLVFLVFLVIQIRRINSKLEYIDESKDQIGLAARVDYLKDFQFDCLQYSMLYYPVMNFSRIVFAHLCIGFAPDFHYVQYGGVLAAQVFYMMIQISSSGYKLSRDKYIYPILDFLYAVFLLCLMGIGLIYGVGHLELTINLEKFGFSLIIVITLIILVQVFLDIVKFCRTSKIQQNQFASVKKLQTNSTNHQQIGKQSEQRDKRISEKSYPKDLCSDFNEQASDKTKMKLSKEGTCKKIKKIKNGKLI